MKKEKEKDMPNGVGEQESTEIPESLYKDVPIICISCGKEIDDSVSDIIYRRTKPTAPTSFSVKKQKLKTDLSAVNTVDGLQGPYCTKCYSKWK